MNTERLRRGLGGCWEVCSRFFSSHSPVFNCREYCPTVAGSVGTDFGLPTVLRFVRFRVSWISLSLTVLQVRRETAQTAKAWPSFRSSLTRSRSFKYLRQSTRHACSPTRLPQSITLRRATLGQRYVWDVQALTRDLGLKTRGGCDTSHTLAIPGTFSPRSRVCCISLDVTDQGFMCVMLTVADKERARPRKMVTGRMAKFDRFLLFSASHRCQWKSASGQ